jgi:hypothetical protein
MQVVVMVVVVVVVVVVFVVRQRPQSPAGVGTGWVRDPIPHSTTHRVGHDNHREVRAQPNAKHWGVALNPLSKCICTCTSMGGASNRWRCKLTQLW